MAPPNALLSVRGSEPRSIPFGQKGTALAPPCGPNGKERHSANPYLFHEGAFAVMKKWIKIALGALVTLWLVGLGVQFWLTANAWYYNTSAFVFDSQRYYMTILNVLLGAACFFGAYKLGGWTWRKWTDS